MFVGAFPSSPKWTRARICRLAALAGGSKRRATTWDKDGSRGLDWPADGRRENQSCCIPGAGSCPALASVFSSEVMGSPRGCELLLEGG